jgi:hypothetical protein
MKSTYLVQRLQKAHPRGDDGVFTFGGGLRKGGFNDKAWETLNKIFRFDYMGSSEFEFGEVPKALDHIIGYVERGDGAIGELKVHRTPIYYICSKYQEEEVKVRIKELATIPRKFRTKESVYLDEAIAARVPANIVPEKKDKYAYFMQYVGWLELDNNFIFFIDKEVFDNLVMMLPIDKKE